jgi:ATP-dependent protease ClpP protease subunit
VEEANRFVKQGFDLEDVRALTWTGLKRMVQLVHLAYGFQALLVHGPRKQVERIASTFKAFGPVPEYMYYRLLEASGAFSGTPWIAALSSGAQWVYFVSRSYSSFPESPQCLRRMPACSSSRHACHGRAFNPLAVYARAGILGPMAKKKPQPHSPDEEPQPHSPDEEPQPHSPDEEQAVPDAAQQARPAEPAQPSPPPQQPSLEQALKTLQQMPPEKLLAMTGELWAQAKNAPTLMLWLRDGSSISRSLAEDVFLALRRLTPPVDDLWVIINSLGGDLHAAYQITRRLQATAKQVHIVIPRMAKSAATLITLGCHEVVMHPMAELGPIDTQAQYVFEGVVKQDSTLNAIKSLEYLKEYAVDTFDRVSQMLTFQGFAPNHAAQTAADITKGIVDPIFSQVNPIQMGEYYRLLDTSKEYAKRLLAVSYFSMDEDTRKNLLKRMAEGYPTHGFIIDVDEARTLGLNARMPLGQELPLLDFGVAFSPGRVRTVALFEPPPAPPPVPRP